MLMLFLQKYLDLAIDPDSAIRKQDAMSAIISVSKNRIGRDVAWNWLRNDFERIASYFGDSITTAVGDIILSVASDFNTKLKIDELKNFVEQHSDVLSNSRAVSTISLKSK